MRRATPKEERDSGSLKQMRDTLARAHDSVMRYQWNVEGDPCEKLQKLLLDLLISNYPKLLLGEHPKVTELKRISKLLGGVVEWKKSLVVLYQEMSAIEVMLSSFPEKSEKDVKAAPDKKRMQAEKNHAVLSDKIAVIKGEISKGQQNVKEGIEAFIRTSETSNENCNVLAVFTLLAAVADRYAAVIHAYCETPRQMFDSVIEILNRYPAVVGTREPLPYASSGGASAAAAPESSALPMVSTTVSAGPAGAGGPTPATAPAMDDKAGASGDAPVAVVAEPTAPPSAPEVSSTTVSAGPGDAAPAGAGGPTLAAVPAPEPAAPPLAPQAVASAPPVEGLSTLAEIEAGIALWLKKEIPAQPVDVSRELQLLAMSIAHGYLKGVEALIALRPNVTAADLDQLNILVNKVAGGSTRPTCADAVQVAVLAFVAARRDALVAAFPDAPTAPLPVVSTVPFAAAAASAAASAAPPTRAPVPEATLA